MITNLGSSNLLSSNMWCGRLIPLIYGIGWGGWWLVEGLDMNDRVWVSRVTVSPRTSCRTNAKNGSSCMNAVAEDVRGGECNNRGLHRATDRCQLCECGRPRASPTTSQYRNIRRPAGKDICDSSLFGVILGFLTT